MFRAGLREMRAELDIGLETELQPAADIVAGDTAARLDLVMAAAAAQVARPAASAGLHQIHMAAIEQLPARVRVRPDANVAHDESRVVDEPVAGIEPPLGIDAEIAGAGAAGERPMRAAMDFLQGGL